MILIIVSVKDLAAGCFGRPAFVHNANVALRGFTDEVNRKDSTDDLSRHPADFELYELGSFSDNDGSFTMLDKPRLIARAIDLKES